METDFLIVKLKEVGGLPVVAVAQEFEQLQATLELCSKLVQWHLGGDHPLAHQVEGIRSNGEEAMALTGILPASTKP